MVVEKIFFVCSKQANKMQKHFLFSGKEKNLLLLKP